MSTSDHALQLSAPSVRAQRAPVEYTRGWAILLVSLDITMFLLSSFVAYSTVGERHMNFHGFFHVFWRSSVVYIVIWLVIFERLGLYRRSFALSVKDEFYYTVVALILGITPQLVLGTLMPALSTSRLALLVSLGAAIATVSGSRALVHAVRNAVNQSRPRRIAIVGTNARVSTVARSLNIVEGTQLLRLEEPDIDATVTSASQAAHFNLEHVSWFGTASRWGCDTLLLTEMLPPEVMPTLLQAAAEQHIKVAFAPPRIQCHAYSLKLATDGQQALIVPTQLRACTPTARLLKRMLDVSVGVPLLLLAAPFMAIAALAVWLESGSPVLFRQERVGRGGNVFEVLKFRSMRTDAEENTGPVWARTNDGRATKVGALLRRTSLDELPQLFNVIRGDMSIVGPRPERPVFVEEFRRLLPRYDERHLVRPGITGWSQVNMRRILEPTAVGEKLSFDLFYVEQWGIFMDLSVIFKTALEFLFHRAA